MNTTLRAVAPSPCPNDFDSIAFASSRTSTYTVECADPHRHDRAVRLLIERMYSWRGLAPVDADETEFPGEPPVAYVARIARAKAELALPRHPGAVILAADTTVWCDPAGPPLGKPADRDAADTMLRALLRAGTHFTTTAFVLADARGPRVTWLARHVTTEVRMRPLADAEVEIEDFAAAIGDELRTSLSGRTQLPELMLESGRALVDDAGSLLATVVGTRRQPGGVRGLVLDAGLNILYTAQSSREALEVALVWRHGLAHHGESDERPVFAPA